MTSKPFLTIEQQKVLVTFRNICAHDERLYCARVGGRKDINYAKMVWMLERYLTREEFGTYLGGLIELFSESLERNGAISRVLVDLGFEELREKILARKDVLGTVARKSPEAT